MLGQLDRDAFIGELLDEALGLGPLEPLLADASVTEIMVVDPATIYVERAGRLELTQTRFTDEERVRAVSTSRSRSSTRASPTAHASTRSFARSRSAAAASRSGASRSAA